MIDKTIQEFFKIKKESLPYIANGSRDDLAIFFSRLNYKIGAEIGVRKGDFSAILCSYNPDLKIICIDPWFRSQHHFRDFVHLVSKYKPIVKRMTGNEALNEIEDNSLDFCYIDANHDFDSVIIDIIGWSKKVKVNGIVSGHDYFHQKGFGVIEAIDAYTKAHNISQWYVTNDRYPSYFWVKKG